MSPARSRCATLLSSNGACNFMVIIIVPRGLLSRCNERPGSQMCPIELCTLLSSIKNMDKVSTTVSNHCKCYYFELRMTVGVAHFVGSNRQLQLMLCIIILTKFTFKD